MRTPIEVIFAYIAMATANLGRARDSSILASVRAGTLKDAGARPVKLTSQKKLRRLDRQGIRKKKSKK